MPGVSNTLFHHNCTPNKLSEVTATGDHNNTSVTLQAVLSTFICENSGGGNFENFQTSVCVLTGEARKARLSPVLR